jgi:hypothetical protein
LSSGIVHAGERIRKAPALSSHKNRFFTEDARMTGRLLDFIFHRLTAMPGPLPAMTNPSPIVKAMEASGGPFVIDRYRNTRNNAQSFPGFEESSPRPRTVFTDPPSYFSHIQSIPPPKATGPVFSHPLLDGIACVHAESPHRIGDVEKEVFGDLRDVVAEEPRQIDLVALSGNHHEARGNAPAAAELSRIHAWLLIQEAATQMSRTNPERALSRLAQARASVAAWRRRASDGKISQNVWEGLETELRNRETLWSVIAQDFRTGKSQIRRATELSLHGDLVQATALYAMAGRRLLNAAKTLEAQGYDAFAHHVLHSGTETALEKAKALPETAGLLEEAERLHQKTHETMYFHGTWMPTHSEDGSAILVPNAIAIRNMAASVAVFLGVVSPNPREIFDSVRDQERLFPVQEALKRLEEMHKWPINGLAGYYADACALRRGARKIRSTLGESVPRFVTDLFLAFSNRLDVRLSEWEASGAAREKKDLAYLKFSRLATARVRSLLKAGGDAPNEQESRQEDTKELIEILKLLDLSVY